MGISHLLEHMVFKGTPKHPNIPQELTEAGADWQIHAYGHVGHGFTNPRAHEIGIAGVAPGAKLIVARVFAITIVPVATASGTTSSVYCSARLWFAASVRP